MNKILIIGPGAYGLCLSEVLQNNLDNQIYLLGKTYERLEQIQTNKFKIFDYNIKPVSNVYVDYKECFKQKYDLIIFAVPSNELTNLVNEISTYINYDVLVINTSKGMKSENEYWVDYFLKTNKHFKYAFLTGPSFAQEVIHKQKTICNLCTKNKTTFHKINQIFKSTYFELVHLKEIKVYEFISSIKNAIAICFGVIHALTNSDNTINALFVKMMQDLQKILLKKFKFSKYSLLTYSTLGDILMCSTSSQSRNFSYGFDLIKLSKEELNEKYNDVTIEGIRTLKFLKEIIKTKNINVCLLNWFIDFIIDHKITTEELISHY